MRFYRYNPEGRTGIIFAYEKTGKMIRFLV